MRGQVASWLASAWAARCSSGCYPSAALRHLAAAHVLLLSPLCWCDLRVPPYLQNPSANTISVIWFSDDATPGRLRIKDGIRTRRYTSTPIQVPSLAYDDAEKEQVEVALQNSVPFKHHVRIEELSPGRQYTLQLSQGDTSISRSFRLPPVGREAVRFMVYADCETEPESTGKHARWPPLEGPEDRLYLVDQTAGYAANLQVMMSRHPDFIAIAGDLVQSGGEQRDWDEFWKHNAGAAPFPAAAVPLFPAIGNHDIFGGPGALGGYQAQLRAFAKYRTYFEFPKDPSVPEEHRGRYYRVDIGPITLITLDGTNGLPENSDRDPNHYLAANSGVPPDFNPGSLQYAWLERQLTSAAGKSVFTFVQFHQTPYSVGVHGLPPGDGPAEDKLSGRPLRILTPLFVKHKVAAVFGGHCELFEHSVVEGVHFYDLGIGGDGLRAPHFGSDSPRSEDRDMTNEHQVFLAHGDATEVWEGKRLVSGGKHYGHLEVDVFVDGDKRWKARLTPAYAFPVMDEDGKVIGWERRIYDDVVTLNGPRAGKDAIQNMVRQSRAKRASPRDLDPPRSPWSYPFAYIALGFVSIVVITVGVAIVRRVA